MLFGNARPRGASRPTLVPVIFAMAALWCAYMSVPVGTAIYLPVVVLVVCAYGACRLVWHDAAAVWNPVTWFLAASAIYYGLGPMIFLSGDTAIGYLRGYYFVDDAALVRTNMLNAVSIGLICAVYESVLRAWPTRSTVVTPPIDVRRDSQTLLLLFAAIGYTATLLVYLMRVWMGDDATAFGILFNLREFSKAALLLAVYRARKGYPRTVLPLVLIAGTELFVAVGTLMKQNVLEVLFVMMLGLMLSTPKRRLLIIGGGVAIAAYLLMVPLFSAARTRVWGAGQTSTAAGVSGVLSFIEGSGSNFEVDDSSSWWWARLAQAPAQAFAMEAHDIGQPGQTFQMALYSFIPRAVWPGKPIMTFGSEFTVLVTGSMNSGASGSGYFAEAYWNLGWLGVAIMAILTGGVYGFFARQNLARLAIGDFRWIPVACLALKMGYRPDDWFVPNIIGTIPIIVAMWVLVRTCFAVFGRARRATVPRDIRMGAADLARQA